MNFYTVEIKRTSYITLQIEATTPDEAETLAWAEIESGESYGINGDADWECAAIYEQFATDETRSNGA